LAKNLEPYRLFFLEDVLPPEQVQWFEMMRHQTATPIAMGELFNNPQEWVPLISHRLIDFIRVHISQIGGITPAKKLAALCEAFGVRTAWHGPGDVSPVGHAANVHLDVSLPNFGVQEWSGMSDKLREVFPGCPEVRNGYVYPNDKPGLGIDIDEDLAAKYPCSTELPQWTLARTPDGTSVRP
jgi:mannonate dehydratase